MSYADTVTNDDPLELRHAWYQIDTQFQGTHVNVVTYSQNVPSIAFEGILHACCPPRGDSQDYMRRPRICTPPVFQTGIEAL